MFSPLFAEVSQNQVFPTNQQIILPRKMDVPVVAMTTGPLINGVGNVRAFSQCGIQPDQTQGFNFDGDW